MEHARGCGSFLAQGQGEEFGDVADEMRLQFLADFLGHFAPVTAVLVRQNDLL